MLDVRAIALNSSNQEIAQTTSNYQLTFQVISDPNGSVKAFLKLPVTPWKILYYPAGDEVFYEDLPSITDEEKTSFQKRVEYLVREFMHSQEYQRRNATK